ncbi:MAG: hypothetical protein IKX00_04665 [Bacilli bacterium]|nr:hypothetical protein [Bacilli bacterium]
MTIYDLQEEKKNYQALRSKIVSMVSKLADFKGYTGKIKNNVSSNYLVNNDETALSKRLYTISLNINNIRSYLFKTIIPAIDKEIKYCNDQINKIKAAEETAAASAKKTVTKAKNATKTIVTKNSGDQFSVYSEVNDYDI